MNTTYQCGHSEDREHHFTAHSMFWPVLLEAAIKSALERPCESCRQQIEAPEQVRVLRAIVAGLGDSYSHISYRSSCGRHFLHVYRRDSKSPSGCVLADSVEDTPATRMVAAELGKRIQQGGLMGEQACRVGMRGF